MNKQDEKYSKSLPNFSQSVIELLVKKKKRNIVNLNNVS